ncbi:MAG: hypothetical protein QME51_06925, partial [Planctomycetota bacterium]|nr:hypothetical protein [Planctomycetota bacterium]
MLEIYKNAKYTDRKQVKIQTTGKGERNIQIGYLIEMPIWKTSYRLILPEEPKAKPYLQGWAIMENPTDEDWNEVNISFVAGNPISFKLDLYTSYYPTRPIISLATLIPLASNLIELANLAKDKSAPAPMQPSKPSMRREGRARGGIMLEEAEMKEDSGVYDSIGVGGGFGGKKMAEALSQSVSAIASGVQIGELFAYESKSPINVGRRQAAMVPIITQDTEGTKILYYRSDISPRLMNAFYLTNSSRLTLETGPVNIFEGSTAVGEGLIRQALQPGMKEIIPYAIEAGCTIETSGRDEYKPVHKASFVNGVMVLRQYYIREVAYKCINKSPKTFTFYLDHPKAGANYTLLEPTKFEEEVAGHYRFKNELPAGKTLDFKVIEQQEVSSRIYVQNQSMDQIRFYLTQGYLSAKAKGFLKEIVSYMEKIAEEERIISEARKETDKLVKDQERFRRNMEILNVHNPRESEKRAEYLERLTKIEDRLEKLDATSKEATERQRNIRAELSQKIQGFSEE